jgi:hypothetical protein
VLRQYRLVMPDTLAMTRLTSGSSHTRPLVGSLGILPYNTPGLYSDKSIVYRIEGTEYGSYPSSTWALPLERMVGIITEQVLHAAPLSTEEALFDPPSRRTQTYLWVGTVREFEEVDRGKQVFAAVGIEARIVRASDDSLIWRGTARLERPVPNGTMPAIVETLSILAAEVVTQLRVQAAHDIAVIPAAAARTNP